MDMVEVKAANELESSDVVQKAKKAINYCKHATDFTTKNNGKPWKYALIPHDKVNKNSSFNGLVLTYIK